MDDRKELFKSMILGYMTYSNKELTEEKSEDLFQKCIAETSKRLKVDRKHLEDVLYSPYFLSVMSFDLLPDMEEIDYLLRYRMTSIIYYVNVYKHISPRIFRVEKHQAKNLYEPSKEWIELQEKYIENLQSHESTIIFGYTKNIDRLVNDFLRGGKMYESIRVERDNLGFKADESKILKNYRETTKTPSAKGFIEYYIQTLDKIILNSPKVDREFIVYRGKTELFRDDEEGSIFEQKGFSSSNIDLYPAIQYAGLTRISKLQYHSLPSYSFSYVEKIIIPKGASVLSIRYSTSFYHFDPEILFPRMSRFKIVRTCKMQEMYYIYETDPMHEDRKGTPKWSGNMCLIEYLQ